MECCRLHGIQEERRKQTQLINNRVSPFYTREGEEGFTVPKDSENFVTYSYTAGRLFSVTKVFAIDSLRPTAKAIRKEIYRSFGTVR
jgi:hypothetical protein